MTRESLLERRLAEAEAVLEEVRRLIGLYEMSYSDPMGLSAEGVVSAIAEAVEAKP